MTPIERQIIMNNSTMMMALSELGVSDITLIALRNRMEETKMLFDNRKSKEPCCDMPLHERLKVIHEIGMEVLSKEDAKGLNGGGK